MTNSVDPDEMPQMRRLIWMYTVFSGVISNAYSKVQHRVRVMLRQTSKIMTKSSMMTNQLLITMAGLIIDYLFLALISQPYNIHFSGEKRKIFV